MRYTTQVELDNNSYSIKKEKSTGIANYVLLVAILFLNPLLSLLIAALLNFFVSIKKTVLYVYVFVYTVFIVNREYFVRFGESNGDDTVRYIPFIRDMQSLGFIDSLLTQREIFSIEPIPRLIWWGEALLGFNINLIIFIQAFFWVIAFALLADKISSRFSFVVFFIGICFFAYTVPYTFFHLYRQAWALSFFVLYIVFFGSRWRYLLLALSCLSHMLIIPVFLVIELLARKIKLSKVLILLIITCCLGYFLWEPISAKFFAYSSIDNFNYNPSKSIIYSIFFCLIFYLSKSSNALLDISRYLLFFLVFVYVIALFPFLADIANRYVLLLSPVLVMMTVPLSIRHRWILFILFGLSAAKLVVMLISDGNIYSFTINGYLGFFNPIDIMVFYFQRSI
ncbi:EpsG family protein [Aeromonas sanarellii]|uniref:EpsG family protein n=1 Tax=Aeromonas sanarellii TaxID=633415 RepID=UPI0038D1A30C